MAVEAGDPNVVHKSDIGGVWLNLANAEAVRGAYAAVEVKLRLVPVGDEPDPYLRTLKDGTPDRTLVIPQWGTPALPAPHAGPEK